MSAPKFTPGPWKPCRAHEDYEGLYFDIDPEDADGYAARPFVKIEAPCGVTVAAAHDLFEFKDANARLIAAAPELYEALDALSLVVGLTAFKHEGQRAPLQDAVDSARAALAKARGESHG